MRLKSAVKPHRAGTFARGHAATTIYVTQYRGWYVEVWQDGWVIFQTKNLTEPTAWRKYFAQVRRILREEEKTWHE